MKRYRIKIQGYNKEWTVYEIEAFSMMQAEDKAFKFQGLNGVVRVEAEELRGE